MGQSLSRAILRSPRTHTNGKPLRVLAITPGVNVPSARFRVRQYVDVLRGHGIEVTEAAPMFGTYPSASRIARPLWAAGAVISRSYTALRSRRYDLTLLQREMIRRQVTAEPFTRNPRVLDVDDAIWLTGGVSFARRLANLATRVICGNSFLADAFSSWHDDITVVPTGVDVGRFHPNRAYRREGLIGWSGSSSGLEYVYAIEPALAKALSKFPHAKVRIVSDRPPRFRLLDPSRVDFVRWSPENEVRTIQEMSVGIMPVPRDEWGRGKCSCKMLLYAACAVPSIVSEVGMNSEVLGTSAVGLGVSSLDDWTDALDQFLSAPAQADPYGDRGRRLVEEKFAINVLAPQLADIMHTAALA